MPSLVVHSLITSERESIMATHDALLETTLTVPEALMAFLHNKDGQLYQSAGPKQLTVAAELAELVLDERIDIDEDGTIRARENPEPAARAWITDVTKTLAEKPVKTDAWIRGRRDAVAVQQQEAAKRGVLQVDRAKLAGVIGYTRHLANETTRARLLAELDSDAALESPRARAVAKLLTTRGLLRVLRLDTEPAQRLAELARTSEGTPLPGPLFSTMDYAIATGVGLVILGD